MRTSHDDVIKLKQFPCYWPFVRGFPPQRSVTWSFDVFFGQTVEQIIEIGDVRRHRAHYGVTVMISHLVCEQIAGYRLNMKMSCQYSRSCDRLIFLLGMPIPERRYLYCERALDVIQSYSLTLMYQAICECLGLCFRLTGKLQKLRQETTDIMQETVKNPLSTFHLVKQLQALRQDVEKFTQTMIKTGDRNSFSDFKMWISIWGLF